MKITKVTYQKTYPTGQYANEKIGLEADIEDGEDIQFVVCNLKHECDQIHQKNNPRLYQEQETTIPLNYPQNESGLHPSNAPTFQAPQPKKLSPEEVLAQLIEDATTLKALKWLEKPSEKYPKTKELYQNKLQSLQTELGKSLSSPQQKAEIKHIN